MMRVFGGYESYLAAPEQVVQEQILVWIAELKAENERRKNEQDEIDRLSRR
jgi:hypothetical protein